MFRESLISLGIHSSSTVTFRHYDRSFWCISFFWSAKQSFWWTIILVSGVLRKNSQSFWGKAGETPVFSGILHVSVKWLLAVHNIVLSAIVYAFKFCASKFGALRSLEIWYWQYSVHRIPVPYTLTTPDLSPTYCGARSITIHYNREF